MDYEYYGSLAEANEYFDNRLHEVAWYTSDVKERPKALYRASQIIDALNFKGHKHTVYELLRSNPDATEAEIRAAEAAQAMEFPRGADTETPLAIRVACYEIAHELLDGKDPEIELESLGVSSDGYSSVRTTYSRNQVPLDHIANGVPSATAWRYLRPFLRDEDELRLIRVS